MGKAIVTISGGIGNQLFQYAFAKLVEQKTGLSVYLYDITEQNYFGRTWQLHHFNISLPIMQFDRANKLLGKGRVLRIIRRILRRLNKGSRFHYVITKDPLFVELNQFVRLNASVPINSVYSPEYHRQGGNILAFINQLNKEHSYWLEGFWQSWMVVDTVRKALKQDLKFSTQPHAKTIALLDKIKTAPIPVAVHLRANWRQLGGGKTWPRFSFHNQCYLPVAYYRKAINHIRQQCHQPTFFIFADDIKQASELLSELESNDDIVYISHQDRLAWEDLLLMKHCRHFILSNSSFAWWGCWLASHSKSICIMPNNWLGYDTGQLVTSRLEMGRDTILL